MDSKAHYLFIHWSSPIDISHLKAFKNSFESEFWEGKNRRKTIRKNTKKNQNNDSNCKEKETSERVMAQMLTRSK